MKNAYIYQVGAEAISLNTQPSNDVYMTVKLRMMSTAPNGNGYVTELPFLNSIIGNKDFYLATPVKVDVAALLANGHLTHLFNERAGEFQGTQVGSIVSFEIAQEDGEYVMYGIARIDKIRSDITNAIIDLYRAGKLFFSFEIRASDVRLKDNLVYIGDGEHNYLTAMCIVSIPAYADATAVTLVAEDQAGNNSGDSNPQENTEVVTEKMDGITTDEVRIEDVVADQIVSEEITVDEVVVVADESSSESAGETSEATIETAEVAPEAAPAAEVEAPEAAEPVSEPVLEANPDPSALISQTNAEIEKMQNELADLRAYKASIEDARLLAEKAKKAEVLKAFAEKIGISVSEHAEDISALNYELIVASFMKEKPEVNPFIGDGPTLSKGKWDGYVTDASGIGE